jgi:hypothetical protein
VGFLGVLLLVLGWYLISGEAIAAKQLPYLASASIPGAVLVVCGFVLAVSGSPDPDTARRIAELHALLTEAVDDGGTGTAVEAAAEIAAGTAAGPSAGTAAGAEE